MAREVDLQGKGSSFGNVVNVNKRPELGFACETRLNPRSSRISTGRSTTLGMPVRLLQALHISSARRFDIP